MMSVSHVGQVASVVRELDDKLLAKGQASLQLFDRLFHAPQIAKH